MKRGILVLCAVASESGGNSLCAEVEIAREFLWWVKVRICRLYDNEFSQTHGFNRQWFWTSKAKIQFYEADNGVTPHE